MARKPALLLDDENVVRTTRTHVKVLFVPFLLGLVIMLAAGFGVSATGESGGGVPRIIVAVLAAVLLVWATIVPWLRWFLWTYTVTNKRLIEQRGILTREGRVIPLNRVNDVAFEKHVDDRILGCGTLVIHDASQQSGLRLHDIPKIEDFHRTVSRLVLDVQGGESARAESI